MSSKPTLEERFWAKVNKHGPVPEHRPELGPCWLWTGVHNRNGYAVFTFDGSCKGAYRFAYKIRVGELIEYMEIDHLCRNRSCVNPTHLEQVTHEENNRRARGFPRKRYKKYERRNEDVGILSRWRKGYCSKGHKYTPENTRWSLGCIVCITCSGPAPP